MQSVVAVPLRQNSFEDAIAYHSGGFDVDAIFHFGCIHQAISTVVESADDSELYKIWSNTTDHLNDALYRIELCQELRSGDLVGIIDDDCVRNEALSAVNALIDFYNELVRVSSSFIFLIRFNSFDSMEIE